MPERTVGGRTLLCGLVAAGALSSAAAFEIEPSVGLSVIATDNVELRPSDEAENDLVTRLQPALRIASSGPRYDFTTNYRMDVLYYARHDDSTSIFNDLNSRLALRLIGDNLFLTSRALVSQVVKDPLEPIAQSNIPRSGNRSNRVTLETSPEWRQQIFGNAFSLAYTLGETSYSDRDLRDVTYHFVDTQLVSEPVERGLSWSVVHEYRKYDYEVFQEFQRQQVMLNLFWNIGNGWAPFASVGLESDYRDRTGAGLDEATWRVGLRRATDRFLFQASGGERSYGASWDALIEFNYGPDSGDVIRFTYSEQAVNTEENRRLRLDISVPEDPLLVPDVEAPGSGRVYTRKRAQLTVRREFDRNSFAVISYYQRNTDFLTPDGSFRPDSQDYGGSGNWEYRLGERTRARTSLQLVNRQFDRSAGSRDRYRTLRTGLDYDLGRLTRVDFWYARQRRSAGQSGARSYTENQVGIGINRRFF